MTDEPFDSFFRRATGHDPYDYQRALGTSPDPPSVLEVPTGAGKTQAVLVSWLHQRANGMAAPRRLVYALPMRTLVEQTARVAREVRERLAIAPDELPVHVLMGGEEPGEDWREQPERDQVLIGTIDMLLSRALNRGYAESRFAWPISFGLLNADCRWVLDEVQLMGAARATSAQLDGLREKLGVARPCQTMWVSATVDREALETVDRPSLGAELTLSDADRSGPLATRLTARKVLERLDLAAETPQKAPKRVASELLERHEPGTRSLVVVNTVERAQAIHEELGRATGSRGEGPDGVLLHSRFRPPERAAHLERATAEVDESGPGRIVVATQVVEAGVDMSSALLATETAPFSSIVQRLGRLNRAGELAEASVLWLDQGELEEAGKGARLAAPYDPRDMNETRRALLSKVGDSLSPQELDPMDVPERPEDPVTLRRRDLLDLFDTSPDLSGMDVDVAPFIREDDDRNVTVFFRDLGTGTSRELAELAASQPRPDRDELVQVPIGELADRPAYAFDHVDGEWTRVQGRGVAPGMTLMLNAQDGGYTAEAGWTGGSTLPVAVAAGAGQTQAQPDSTGDDPASIEAEPQTLEDHLARAEAAAQELSTGLGLDGETTSTVCAAAALHDIGKAHEVFQGTMRALIAEGGREGEATTLWAKSGGSGQIRHSRPFFRHELASALAVRAADGALAGGDRDLVSYLILAHHGKVRLSIRPAPGEEIPADARGSRFALGIADGDGLPAVTTPLCQVPATELDLSCMELGAQDSWADMTARLRDDPDLGPFRLGFLEALVRVSDWRASA